MPVTTVIGGQWGDEGKGKVVDLLAEKVHVVVRFSGGDNAGHTVVNEHGSFGLRLVPSGIFSPLAVSVIGNGVVINPAILIQEIEQLNQRGVDTSRLFISDRAHLILPYHILLDGLEEEQRGGKALGTTRRGIGPAYADKAARLGIRAGDLLDNAAFRERLEHVLDTKNMILTRVYGLNPLSFDAIYEQYSEFGKKLAPFIRDVTGILEETLRRGGKILLEGAQGTLLDPDFGTYPYTTSSSSLAAGACLGSGLGPSRINHILGVFKAYCSRVGGGPMPTELKDDVGSFIRERAHEYGTTTGRPRRCGWFDGVAAAFSSRLNGFSSVAITRLDVLDTIPRIRICTAYRLDGKVIDHFPASAGALERCEPVYEEMLGWETPTSKIREFDKLPPRARQYLSRIKEILACPISLVSVGPEREQTIMLSQIV
ncbi:MAG: adenylosuccinate synthase [Chloroflexi bacterium]|nr:adenylosuccinate synthase [Chloroflexota bacterium]